MNGKPQDFMRVGLIHFMAFPEVMSGTGPIVETLEKICADDYFQAIEVTHIEDAAVRGKAVELVRNSGKSVAFGAQPVLLSRDLDLNSLDPKMRQAAVDAMRECLSEAVEWKAEGFSVLSGADPDEEQRETAAAMLCASLKEICEISRRMGGPPILLETFDRVPFGKNCLIGPTVEAATLARKVGGFYYDFGLILDLSHLPLLGETAEQAITTAGAFLRHAHIGNCVMRDPDHPAYGDNHPLFGIEEGENGVAELTTFLKALLEAGFIGEGKRNIVSFELKPFGDQSFEDVITNARETLDAAWTAL